MPPSETDDQDASDRRTFGYGSKPPNSSLDMPTGELDLPDTSDLDDPPPGVRRWLISCDESGIDGNNRYYGFGSLWMSWQRRGDFARELQSMRDTHSLSDELKWNKVGRRNFGLYSDLVDYFFRTSWLSFHAIIFRRAVVKKAQFHQGDWDLARRKHFTMLLTNKIQRRVKLEPSREQTFRVWVDPIPSSYSKADEALGVIANNVLAQVFGSRRPVDKVITRDSKKTPSIQLCDVLLGAVLAHWQQRSSSPEKARLATHIASHLGWPDLGSDTHVSERKFNIWYFHDPTLGAREVATRDVKLRHPLPEGPLRRSRSRRPASQ